jgi:hypothetical protein
MNHLSDFTTPASVQPQPEAKERGPASAEVFEREVGKFGLRLVGLKGYVQSRAGNRRDEPQQGAAGGGEAT